MNCNSDFLRRGPVLLNLDDEVPMVFGLVARLEERNFGGGRRYFAYSCFPSVRIMVHGVVCVGAATLGN